MHPHPHRARLADPVHAAVSAGRSDLPLELRMIEEGDRTAVAEAALAGWLQAEGFVGRCATGTNTSLTIEFQLAGEEELAWIAGHLDVAFPHFRHELSEADEQSTSVRRVRLRGEALRGFVERWGLLAPGAQKRVPERLYTASHDEIVAYLRSIFQSDGYVSVRRSGACENARAALAVAGERWARTCSCCWGRSDLLALPQARAASSRGRCSRSRSRPAERARFSSSGSSHDKHEKPLARCRCATLRCGGCARSRSS
jgi:hypothetical protein